MKLTFRFLFVLAALVSSTFVFAWNDTAHMVIAAIGDGRLDESAWKECHRLLATGLTPKTSDFLEAACSVSSAKGDEHPSWDRIDTPYRPDGKPSNTKPAPENIVWAIGHFGDILKDKTKPDAERADALRHLIAYIADIHQPLNAIRMESDQYPDGDQGGALVRIKAAELFPTLQNPPGDLRALWDMGCGAFMMDAEKRPLDGAAEARLQIQGIDLTTQYSPASFVIDGDDRTKDLNPADWAKESYQTAVNFAYKVRTGGMIDLLYVTEGKTICGQRAALAGYRMAALLNKLVGKG
ncbi:MAG TPA: S1/P1 nuclease [Fimbriimonadaceae bacterium]|nr:S1/P1 nuclease [Fimbriimonadaceae bacterium]